MTFDDIVNGYIREYREDARAEMADCERELSPSAAIRKAALCEWQGDKRHPRQRRIPRILLERVEGRLQGISGRLARAPNFAALHRLVEREIRGIKRIGDLTVYDIAHRISAHFGKSPERGYLHASTKIGAQTFDINGKSFDPKLFPKPFSRLAPSEIEDCLCIYKNDLRGVPRRSRPSRCRVARRPRAIWSDFVYIIALKPCRARTVIFALLMVRG